jgi:hypothetical protein
VRKDWDIFDKLPMCGKEFIYLQILNLSVMLNDPKTLYIKYISLLQFLIDRKSCTLETVQSSNELYVVYGEKISERTFFRHRREIEKNFNIKIRCSRLSQEYSISEKDIQAIESNYFYDWLKQSLSLSDLITQNISMNKRIILDNTPAGQDLLPKFVEAMRTNQKVKIAYHPFETSPYEVIINPLVLKVFKQRWYVIGESDKIKLYSLGRMNSCDITDETFELKKNFNPEQFFDFTYGVTIGDETQKPSTIKIKVEYQKHYLRELPMHDSQIEHDMGDYSIFEYYMKPSNEFIMEVMSYGDKAEVLEPIELREKMKAISSNMNKKYNTSFNYQP